MRRYQPLPPETADARLIDRVACELWDVRGSILVTGAAGFLGSAVCQTFLHAGFPVVGVDNFDAFYNPGIKRARAARLAALGPFRLHDVDVRDEHAILQLLQNAGINAVVHLAALAGVRPSLERPQDYMAVNVQGTANVLDAAIQTGVERVVFGSSSSVYGERDRVPFHENDAADQPVSPYAASKRAGELLAATHWNLYQLPVACLRFFTLYGPHQRPDLAIATFMERIARHEAVPVFGRGSTSRDYTYIDDAVLGIAAALGRVRTHRIWNIGSGTPVMLTELLETLADVTGLPVRLDHQPERPGDVTRTFADLTRARAELDYQPRTTLADGLARQWAAREQDRLRRAG